MQGRMAQFQSQPQVVYARKSGHAGAIIAIIFLFLLIGFFVVPVVNIASANYVVANISVTGSVSYSLFGCGEVHVTGSTIGVSVDRYEWVCGNQNP